MKRFLVACSIFILVFSIFSSHAFATMTKDQELQFPYFSDKASCSPVGALIGGGSGDGYTVAAPNLKDPAALASAIDQFIEQTAPSSPFAGMGQYFVSGSMRAGINPIITLALARKESQLGTARDPQVLHAFNAFGRTASASQPQYVGPTGIRWYKYDSWEESLDGNGAKEDHPTYLRERYFEDEDYDINDPGLNFMYLYAPPHENDTAGYIHAMQDLLREFVEVRAPEAYAAPGTPPPATSTSVGGNPCATGGDGVIQGNIVQTALNLAWPDEKGSARGVGKQNSKPEYQAAFKQFYEDLGGGMHSNPYSDCGIFVGVVMRSSGVDADYPLRMTGTQQNYMRNSDKYEVITNPSADDLRPGDIINYDSGGQGHTLIYTGDTGDGFVIADASLDTHVPERGTMANVTWMLGRPNVVVARLK